MYLYCMMVLYYENTVIILAVLVPVYCWYTSGISEYITILLVLLVCMVYYINRFW